MKENLGELIFDIITEDYKDKIEPDKDLISYLKENTKTELLSTYLLYGYAGNVENIVEQIVSLQNKRKEEIVKQIDSFLHNEISSILKFLSPKRMEEAKYIASKEGTLEFCINKGNYISLDTIKILKQLKFIFCKKEGQKIIIHMPNYIKEKINSVATNLYTDYYDEIINYTKGMADTYGVIRFEDAYDIIKKDVLINFERYESMIQFISVLELAPIYYSFARQSICNFNLNDEEIDNILCEERELTIYDRDMYKDIGNETYLLNLKEYMQFRNFLKEFYLFDIEEDEFLRETIINDYIDMSQINEKYAKEKLEEDLEQYFEIDNFEKQKIINYIDKVRKKMPVWKNGGKIDNENQFTKVGRNEQCPCGSGKKYKNCHGK